jgi:hypothetical protein
MTGSDMNDLPEANFLTRGSENDYRRGGRLARAGPRRGTEIGSMSRKGNGYSFYQQRLRILDGDFCDNRRKPASDKW